MSYIYKRSLRFKSGAKEYVYSLGKNEVPSFMGGMFGKPEEISGIEEFVNKVNQFEDAKHFSFYELEQEDLNKVIKAIRKKIVSFKYVDIKSESITLDLKYLVSASKPFFNS